MKKTFLYFLILQVLSYFSFAQPVKINQPQPSPLRSSAVCDNSYYINLYANPTYDLNLSELIDAGNGNYISVGSASDRVTYENDAIIAKYDALGTKLWELVVASNESESIRTVIKLQDGNFLAVGFTYPRDYFLLKFTTNGTIIWKKDFDVVGQSLAGETNIREDTDGSLILSSRYVESSLSFNDRFYICKFNATGNILFSKTYNVNPTPNSLYSRDLLVKNGHTYLLGTYFPIFQANQFEGILLKLDNRNGNIEWTKHYDFNGGPADFIQILDYNDSTLCITGKGDINASDTSYILLCDTSGKVSSLNYFAYNAYAAGGIACLDKAGNLLFAQRNMKIPSSPLLDLIHVNPLNGIHWSKTYPQINGNSLMGGIFYAQDSSIILGKGSYLFSISKFFIARFTQRGDVSCTPNPLPINFGQGRTTAANENFISHNYPTAEISGFSTAPGNNIRLEDVLCKMSCTSIDLSAPDKLCHVGDTLTVSISKNAECLLDPEILYDNSFFKLIDQSKTVVRFKSLRAGTSPVKALISTTCSVIEDEVNIRVIDNPTQLELGSDTAICGPAEIILKADPRFEHFLWQDNSIESYLKLNSTGIYFVKATDSCGNIFRDTVKININYTSPVSLRADTTICSGDSIVLVANGGFFKYQWNTGETGQQIIAKAMGEYSLIATNPNMCLSKDTFRIEKIFNIPSINLSGATWLCEGVSSTLNAGTGYQQYTWNTGSTLSSISVTSLGIYWVIVTDNNHCKATDTIAINEFKKTPGNFLPADTTLCNYGKLTITATDNFASYAWNTGANTRSLQIQKANTYTLQVKDQFGCIGKDTISIAAIDCLTGFYIPNAFTPNGDGKNDVFKPIVHARLLVYRLSIYNRWGQKIFESTEPEKGWDGLLNGKKQDNGGFIWTCEYQMENNALQIEKGTVMLLR